jgi:hypothetical protein
MAELTAEKLRALLDYDPNTGEFRWTKDRKGGARKGSVAGYLDDMGYVRIGIDNERHRGHQLAWLHAHGVWPIHDIDHIDGERANNQLANLRDVPRRVNLENQRTAKRGRSGLLGVTARDGRFVAQIRVRGVHRYLGRYDTAEEAHAAYLRAKRLFHEGCTL